MKKVKSGKIVPNGVVLEKHEYSTVLFLTMLGYNIDLIPPSHTPGVRTPDFKMDGRYWEMKSPDGNGKSTLEHAFQNAAHQSENVVFDLRRTKIPDKKALSILHKLMTTSRRVKNLYVISKTEELLRFGIDF